MTIHNLNRIVDDITLIRDINNHYTPFEALLPGIVTLEVLKDGTIGAFQVTDIQVDPRNKLVTTQVSRTRIFPVPAHPSIRTLKAESYRSSGRMISGKVVENIYRSYYNRLHKEMPKALNTQAPTVTQDMEPIIGDITRAADEIGRVLERFSDYIQSRSVIDKKIVDSLDTIVERVSRPDWAAAHASRLMRATIQDLRAREFSEKVIAERLGCAVKDLTKWGGYPAAKTDDVLLEKSEGPFFPQY